MARRYPRGAATLPGSHLPWPASRDGASRRRRSRSVPLPEDLRGRQPPSECRPRPHRRAGRPRAQPQGRRPRPAPRRADRVHRTVRFGQVVAGVRHHLRRGPAPLRRVAVGLRAPVPRADGQAGRRLHRGAVAGDLHRPEVDLPQPAFHGRAPSPRSTTTCGCCTRVSGSRTAPTAAGPSRGRPPSRSSTRSTSCPPAPASRSSRRSSGAQGRARGPVPAAVDRRVRPCAGRRRRPPDRRGPEARQDPQAHHRGRGRPAGPEGGHAPTARGLDRDRAPARRRHRDDRGRSDPRGHRRRAATRVCPSRRPRR